MLPRNEAQARRACWEYIDRGRHRVVFLAPSGRSVVKFPRNSYGEEANYREAEMSRQGCTPYGPDGSLARCRLIRGLMILVMERVAPVTKEWRQAAPDSHWCWSVDASQVGHTRHGVLVAYDYADDYRPSVDALGKFKTAFLETA